VTEERLTPGKLGGLPVRRAGDIQHKPCPLIYGNPGIGKTTLACSAADVPELSPVIYLGIEIGGAVSIKEKHPEIDVIPIKTLKELQGVFDDLYRQNGAGYKTVIADNATEGQNIGFDHYFAKTMSGKLNDFTEFNPATWANGAYSWSTEQMRKLAHYFQLLPMVTIFTAWANDFGEGGRRDIRPALTNKASLAVTGVFQDVYYYHMGSDGVRRIQTTTTPSCIAKDRTGRLPSLIDNPTMQIIHDYWTGVRKKEDEKPKDNGVARPGIKPAVKRG
jgi:hypothetical protein